MMLGRTSTAGPLIERVKSFSAFGLALAITAWSGCAPVRTRVAALLPGSSARMAGGVEILRDGFGRPHIRAETDAAVAFGLGYVQAEDDLERLESLFIRATGRSANLFGERMLGPDLARAAFQIERWSRLEYESRPKEERRIWEAYTDGINYFISTHPDVRPRLIHRYEPWFVFALPRSRAIDAMGGGWHMGEVQLASDSAAWQAIASRRGETDADVRGLATGWAVRSEQGVIATLERAGTTRGAEAPYEAHVESGAGWSFAGLWLFGTPVAVAGHSGRTGWSVGSNPERSEATLTRLLWSAESNALVGPAGDTVAVEMRQVSFAVNSPVGVVPRVVTLRFTRYGPVIATAGDTVFAARMPALESGGRLPLVLAMLGSAGVGTFASAAGEFDDAIFVDSSGVIVRIDEGAASTDTLGGEAGSWYIDRAHRVGSPDSVLAALGRPDARIHAVAAQLESRGTDGAAWTLDAAAGFAFEARFVGATREIARLVDAWERIGASDSERAARADEAIDTLRLFNGLVDTASAATTLYAAYSGAVGLISETDTTLPYAPRVDALSRAAAGLARRFGSVAVPWGEAIRLEADSSSTRPVLAGPGYAGVIAAIQPDSFPGSGSGAAGSTGETDGAVGEPAVVEGARVWVMIVRLGGAGAAYTAAALNTDGGRSSTPLLGAERLRPLTTDWQVLERESVERYSPGRESGGETRDR